MLKAKRILQELEARGKALSEIRTYVMQLRMDGVPSEDIVSRLITHLTECEMRNNVDIETYQELYAQNNHKYYLRSKKNGK